MVAGGRPRDPRKDAAILEAARSILLEVGYAALTMEAVAARASVSKPTVYLRYPSKTLLVFDAVFGRTKLRPIPETEDLRADLEQAYGWAVEEFASPEARAAVPGLVADIAASSELAGLVRDQVVGPEHARVGRRLHTAQDRGQIRPDVDLDLVVDVFVGTALARILILDRPVDQAFGRRLVETVLRGVLART